jgi:adenylate cyclase
MQNKIKRFLWEWRGVWITAPSIAGLIILLRFIGLFQPWEWAAYDQYMRQRPQLPKDDRIVIVGIDEADLKEVGKPIFPDGVYAQLLEKLKARKPRVIGLDIYRDLPIEPGHEELVRVFESTPNLVGIQKVVGDSKREAVGAPPALKAKKQVGANDLILDADNKVRRSLLYLQSPQNKETVFSFGLYVALLYLDAEGIKVQGKEIPWRLGKATFNRFQANDGGYIKADDDGYQILLNYRGPARHFDTVSMTDILKDRVPADWGRDRIILIGAVGESLQDLHYTPYSSNLLSLPEPMPGVEIHANIASQIISATKEGRPLIQSLPEPTEWLWILLWSGVGCVVSWQRKFTRDVSKFSLNRVIIVIFAGGALVASTYIAFLASWWIPIIPPLLAFSGSIIAITAYIARSAGEIRKTFGRYLTDEVVANLLENPEGLKFGGDRRKITILTSDLRGFTSLSEQLQPEAVVKILNFYLGYMADVITKYQGTIDEFMGDGILVLFGAPVTREDDAKRAVACAVAMQLAMTAVNEKMKEWELPKLEMGIGINTGEVVVGNIGSEKRSKYGVVGSQVNLTYRIESYTVGGQILVSEPTLKAVESIARIDWQKEVKPKGVKEALTIYEIGGLGGEYNLYLPKKKEEFLPLPDKISLQFHYALLDGKHISNSLFQGSLVKLSARGAEIRSDKELDQAVPEPLSNIKLNLLSPDDPTKISADIYGKVLEMPTEKGSFYLHFTSLPQDVESMLESLYKSIKK